MNRILLSCTTGLGIVLLLAFLAGAAFAFQGDMSGAPVPGDSKDSVRQKREHARQVQEKVRQMQEKARQARSHFLQFQCHVQCVRDNAGERKKRERKFVGMPALAVIKSNHGLTCGCPCRLIQHGDFIPCELLRITIFRYISHQIRCASDCRDSKLRKSSFDVSAEDGIMNL